MKKTALFALLALAFFLGAAILLQRARPPAVRERTADLEPAVHPREALRRELATLPPQEAERRELDFLAQYGNSTLIGATNGFFPEEEPEPQRRRQIPPAALEKTEGDTAADGTTTLARANSPREPLPETTSAGPPRVKSDRPKAPDPEEGPRRPMRKE